MAVPAGLQVMIFACRRGEEATPFQGKDAPVFVASADGAGYFFDDVPNEQFDRAAAQIAGCVAGRRADTVIELAARPARSYPAVRLRGSWIAFLRRAHGEIENGLDAAEAEDDREIDEILAKMNRLQSRARSLANSLGRMRQGGAWCMPSGMTMTTHTYESGMTISMI